MSISAEQIQKQLEKKSKTAANQKKAENAGLRQKRFNPAKDYQGKKARSLTADRFFATIYLNDIATHYPDFSQ